MSIIIVFLQKAIAQGIAILYNILNQAEGISCERGYVPWPDMGDAMREAGIPLL